MLMGETCIRVAVALLAPAFSGAPSNWDKSCITVKRVDLWNNSREELKTSEFVA